MRKTVMVGVVSLVMASAAARADEWRAETLAEQVHDCSIALDAGDVAHLAFTMGFATNLNYGRRDPGGWSFESLAPYFVQQVDLRLGTDGAPRIGFTYYTWPDGAVRLADRSTGVWEVEEAVARAAVSPSLAVDRTGAASIAYVDIYDDGKMFLAHQRGGEWAIQQLTNNPVQATSMVLDSAGRLQVAYVDSLERTLKYARFTGTSWVFETVGSVGTSLVGRPSLSLDRLDRPVIGYSSEGAIRVARKMAGGWRSRVVETLAQDSGVAVSLRVDGIAGVHIAYAPSPTELHYARQLEQGPGWNIQTVDRAEGLGFGLDGVSMALDSAGHAHIAYVVVDPLRILRYATNAGPTSTDEAATISATR